MIRTGNIEQLLNCSFMILWSRTHLIRRYTDHLLQRQLDSPTNFNNLKKKKGANIQTLQVFHVLPLALVISNSNTSTFVALCAAMKLSFR